jgi:hypothetical protein
MNGLDSPEKKKKRIEEEKTKREKSGKEVKWIWKWKKIRYIKWSEIV